MSVDAGREKVHVSPEKLRVDVVLAPDDRDPGWRYEAADEDHLSRASGRSGRGSGEGIVLLLTILLHIPLLLAAVVDHNQIVRLFGA